MSDPIYLANVRLSFPKLIEAAAPTSTPTAAKKFGCDLIMPMDHPDLTKFMAEVNRIAGEKWKDHAAQILRMIQPDRRLRCWGAGEEKVNSKTLKTYEGYEGMRYISASSDESRPPMIIKPDGRVADNPIERAQVVRKLYGGCYVNAAIRPWPQDNQFGRAIRCELVAVQFSQDGEAFGEGAPDVTGMFKSVQTTPEYTGLPWMPWM